MHELAVAQALVAQVEAIAHERVALVRVIHVQIGPLSGVEPELLRRAFPLAAGGGAAAEAELLIATPPLRVRCRACSAESTATTNRLLCAACGEWRVDVLSGEEMLLERVELEPLADSGPAKRGAATLT